MDKFYVITVLVLLSACTIDYEGDKIVESLSDEIPNTIIYMYETVQIQDGAPVLQISADKAEVYDNKEETHFTRIDFYNFDDGEIDNHGSSNRAVLQIESGDARFDGAIVIESKKNNSFVKAESLSWLDSDKILYSDKEDFVTVVDEDGSQLAGSGFKADVKKKTILFHGKTTGAYNSNEN